MARISCTRRRINQDLQLVLPKRSIRQACRKVGYRWRNRLLDPVATLHLFILGILNFNIAITHLRHLAKVPVNALAGLVTWALAFSLYHEESPVGRLETLLGQGDRLVADRGFCS